MLSVLLKLYNYSFLNIDTQQKIKDLLQLKEEKQFNSFLTVKVLNVRTPVSYTNKQGQAQNMLTCTVADETAQTKLQIYDAAKFPLVSTNECLILHDFILKEDG